MSVYQILMLGSRDGRYLLSGPIPSEIKSGTADTDTFRTMSHNTLSLAQERIISSNNPADRNSSV